MADEPVSAVAVVGAGPRGTGILERLVARARASDEPLHIHVVDPFPPGAGRIWRREQDSLLWMNSAAADVAMFTDATSSIDSPIAPGPTLAEWVEHNRAALREDSVVGAEAAEFGAGSFPSRTLHSRYLTDVFERIVRGAPAHVRIDVRRARVIDIVDDEDGRQRLTLDDGTSLRTDSVILAQGHPDTDPAPREVELATFARTHGLTYLAPGYTADLDPTPVPEGEPVLVAGIGLAFVDWMVLLTESRGGTYTRDADGVLSYTPSGREPQLLVGSRRGVPYHAKISYSIADARPALPHFFGPDAIDGTSPVDFDSQVWPLIAKELAWAHYAELFRSHPARTATSWAEFETVLAAHSVDSPAMTELVERTIPNAHDRFDLARLDRPLAGRSFTDPDQVHRAVLEHARSDLARRRDPAFSSDAAVFSALLSVYASVGELVRTGRLSPQSIARDVEGRLHSFFSFMASGPPPERLEQMVALGEAGVITFLGPDVDFTTGAGTFVAHTVTGEVRSRTYIEARLPVPAIAGTTDPLLRTLHGRGEVVELRATADSAAKLQVDGRSRLVGAAKTAHPRRFAVGPWVAGHTWSTAFPRPGVDAGFFRHNDAVAADLLSAARQPPTGRNPRCSRSVVPVYSVR